MTVMKIEDLERRFFGMPESVNALLSVGLAGLVCLQVWALTFWDYAGSASRTPPGALTYALAALSFLPLVARRRWPTVALAASGAAAFAYIGLRYPPAFVIAGPMIATYSVVVYGRRRAPALLAFVTLVLVLATFAFTVPGSGWLAEVGGDIALLAAAAFMGAVQRSRRATARAAEERALEAERSRDEEARRRVAQERVRIAREVHDVVAHTLSAAIVQADAALQVLRGAAQEADGEARGGGVTAREAGAAATAAGAGERRVAAATEALETIAGNGREALAELRSLLRVLRTDDDTLPLRDPTPGLAQITDLAAPARRAGLEVDLELPRETTAVPAVVGLSAYRVTQEAVTNTLRHSGAARLSIRVARRGDELDILVRDDGHVETGDDGVDGRRSVSNGVSQDGEGHGLKGMAERVEALGGTLTAGAHPDGGFEVHATLPLDR